MNPFEIIYRHAHETWVAVDGDEERFCELALESGRAARDEIKASSVITVILIIWTLGKVMFWIWWLYNLWREQPPKGDGSMEVAAMQMIASRSVSRDGSMGI